MGSTQRCMVGKGGRETLIDAPRRPRAHPEQLNLPRDFAGHGAKSAFVHSTRDPG